MNEVRERGLAPLREPLLLVPFGIGGVSILTLLLYFYGQAGMGASVLALLLPAAALLAVFLRWARRSGREELFDRVRAGLWAGALATLAYDVVRVPVAVAGVPVFKAISYFGTVMLGQPTPTLATEVAGWTYHLSNGIGFGLMYAVLVERPRWWTATLWGLGLELCMLLTPYAEVFGYKVSNQFLSITIGAHVVYGVVLWAGLRYWLGGRSFGTALRPPASRLALLLALVPLGIGGVAWDFHARHVATIPPSPPPYLGPHLYVTWNVLEVDRIGVLWLTRRYADPEARYHFVEPFTQIRHGKPIDTPEAEVRRMGARAATEVLVERLGLDGDPKLALLARTAHLEEITPWMRPADPEAFALGQEVIAAAGDCARPATGDCVERAFQYLDEWYAADQPAASAIRSRSRSSGITPGAK